MKFFLSLFLIATNVLFSVEVKLKDLAKIQGLRDNQLTGFGIVTGLANSGDTKNAITNESLKNYLKNQGLSTVGNNSPNMKNIASVMIIVNIPTYAKSGDRLDVTVASIGDAKSLEGGVLLQSPLKAANGDIIAVASGILSFGGKDLKMYNNLARTNPKTVGMIQGGAIVEKELSPLYVTKLENPDAPDEPKFNRVSVILNDQDFANLDQINESIRSTFTSDGVTTNVTSPIEIQVLIPEAISPVKILARLENITIEPQSKARVVVNERTGTIVMGSNVTVEEVAISKQGISVVISSGSGRRFYEENPEKVENVLMVKQATKVEDLVKALNKIGASTKDVIAILEGLRKSGALHAEVIVQ
ncbi:MAG: flagellar basal body P-ring protein FlgI [Leptospiraceae bacterium]|nr:flagellar basal body P-ring protein FlgI [Leptospiraceae bacterium]